MASVSKLHYTEEYNEAAFPLVSSLQRLWAPSCPLSFLVSAPRRPVFSQSFSPGILSCQGQNYSRSSTLAFSSACLAVWVLQEESIVRKQCCLLNPLLPPWTAGAEWPHTWRKVEWLPWERIPPAVSWVPREHGASSDGSWKQVDPWVQTWYLSASLLHACTHTRTHTRFHTHCSLGIEHNSVSKVYSWSAWSRDKLDLCHFEQCSNMEYLTFPFQKKLFGLLSLMGLV